MEYINNSLTGAGFPQRFLGLLTANPLASHVDNWLKFLLIIFARWQHNRVLQKTVDAVKHVLAAVSDVCNLMKSLHNVQASRVQKTVNI